MASQASSSSISAEHLTAEQLAFFHANGYLVLEGFASAAQTQAMQARALELVQGFDQAKNPVSVFTTDDQVRTSDAYFLESGDKVRFFFEEHAWNADGTLRQSKEESINKYETHPPSNTLSVHMCPSSTWFVLQSHDCEYVIALHTMSNVFPLSGTTPAQSVWC